MIGVTNGWCYALVALGYTLVYGILELIDFAHGDMFMLGGMMSPRHFMVQVFGVGTGTGAGDAVAGAAWVARDRDDCLL